MTEKCSVIVLNYNGKQLLKECLSSLKEQSFNDYKVYVVDNSSTDGSVEFVENNFPWVTVIKASENFGTAEGSNVGVRNTRGEYIVLTSNDIRVDKYCIETLIKTMESDSTIGICTSKLLKYTPDPVTEKYHIDNAGGIVDRFIFPMMLRSNEIDEDTNCILEEVFFSCGGCFIIKRELFNKIGGFDYKYFTLSDDIDLSWRVRLAGFKVVVNHSSFIYHKVSATLGPLFPRPQKRFWSERNSLRSILKNYEASTLVTVLPQYFFLLFLEGSFYILTGRFSLFFSLVRAVWWNIINCVDTAKERQKVNSFRVINDRVILNKMHKGSLKVKTLLDVIKKSRKECHII